MSIFRFFKDSFITGLIALAPIGITVYVCWVVFSLSDTWIEQFGITTPGVGAAILIGVLLLVGVSIRLYFGSQILSLVEWLINKIPPVALIYNATKDVSSTVLNRDKGSFKAVVKVGVGGHYVLGFLTKDVPETIDEAFGADVVAVIVFQVFSPGSGFTLFVHKNSLQEIDIPVDVALKLSLTAGMMAEEDETATKV